MFTKILRFFGFVPETVESAVSSFTKTLAKLEAAVATHTEEAAIHTQDAAKATEAANQSVEAATAAKAAADKAQQVHAAISGIVS